MSADKPFENFARAVKRQWPDVGGNAAPTATAWLDDLDAAIAEDGITDATLIATAVGANAHATLALVEQQRIGNLIAYNQAYPLGDGAQTRRDEIERRLGLKS